MAGIGIGIIGIRVLGGVLYLVKECCKGSLKKIKQQKVSKVNRRVVIRENMNNTENDANNTERNKINDQNSFLAIPVKNINQNNAELKNSIMRKNLKDSNRAESVVKFHISEENNPEDGSILDKEEIDQLSDEDKNSVFIEINLKKDEDSVDQLIQNDDDSD